MLTRVQVARRLGKSIATVRRLEGSQLHPRRDASGVLRFDDAEVHRLAAARGLVHGRRSVKQGSISAGRAARSGWFTDRVDHDGPDSDVDTSDEVHAAVGQGADAAPRELAEKSEAALLEARVRELEDRLARAGREESPLRQRRWMHGRIVRELLDELESLSDAELRRLEPEQLDAIAKLIHELT